MRSVGRGRFRLIGRSGHKNTQNAAFYAYSLPSLRSVMGRPPGNSTRGLRGGTHSTREKKPKIDFFVAANGEVKVPFLSTFSRCLHRDLEAETG